MIDRILDTHMVTYMILWWTAVVVCIYVRNRLCFWGYVNWNVSFWEESALRKVSPGDVTWSSCSEFFLQKAKKKTCDGNTIFWTRNISITSAFLWILSKVFQYSFSGENLWTATSGLLLPRLNLHVQSW